MRIAYEKGKSGIFDFSKIDVFRLGLVFLFVLDRPNLETDSDKYNQNERILIDYLEDFGKIFSYIENISK